MSEAVEQGYWSRVCAALDGPALGLVVLLAWLVSMQILFQPHLFELWTLSDIAQAWTAYFGEILVICALTWLAVVMAEQCRPRAALVRGVLLATAVVAPVVLMVWLIAWRHSGQWWPTAPLAVLGEAMRYTLLGGFIWSARTLKRHTERANAQVLFLETVGRELDREAAQARLQVLQAQIEPHFLFNTLANVRRLYHKQPAAGAEAIDNLMTYLRAALPRMRRVESTLGEEFELARAYLQLLQVRMGSRLAFTLDLPPALHREAFPPMVLVTLAENAIKHGLAPAILGGTVQLSARQRGETIEVSVVDDGVGFSADSGGHGMGLANIRRQLAARFGSRASLSIEQRDSGGVSAQLVLPCSDATPSDATPRVATPVAAARA